jgi:hypothetical protein
MAIVVLLLWMFTAGAGFYLLVTSSLGRARSAAASTPASGRTPAPVPSPQRVAASAAAAPSGTLSPREAKRAARERWDPPSLVAARQAPILPSGQALVEFAHPAVGIVGLGFWLGFTLVHNHALGWIAFGLAAVTACVGLGWFTANTRAARRAPGPAPSFAGRLVALHGSAATLTVALAALAALVLR